MGPMSDWAVQFNKNPFGFTAGGPLQLQEVAPNGGTAQTLLPLQSNAPQMLSGAAPSLPLYLEVAIRTSVDVFYLSVGYDLSAVLMDGGPVGQDAFQNVFFRQAPPESKKQTMGQLSQKVTPDQVIQRMKQYYVYVVAQKEGPDADLMYFSATTNNK